MPKVEHYSDLLTYAATLRLQNKTSWEIKEALEKEKELPEELAERITEESYTIYTRTLLESSNKALIWGSVLLVAGLLVTLISMKSGGSSYIIAYGAIIGGFVRIIIGIVQRNKI